MWTHISKIEEYKKTITAKGNAVSTNKEMEELWQKIVTLH